VADILAKSGVLTATMHGARAWMMGGTLGARTLVRWNMDPFEQTACTEHGRGGAPPWACEWLWASHPAHAGAGAQGKRAPDNPT